MDDGTKTCATCHEVKPLSAFNRLARSPDGRQPRCRACCRAWYEQHRTEHIANVMQRKQRLRPQRVEWSRRLRAERGCADCGEDDPDVLDFDHLRDKSGNVSQFVNGMHSWGRVEAEIEKCDVVCANCHRRRTRQRRLIRQRVDELVRGPRGARTHANED